MKYVSTRGGGPSLSFEEVVLAGLAPDGGLYVPEALPFFDREEIAGWAGLDYAGLAFKLFQPFVAGEITDAELRQIIDKAYSHEGDNRSFRHEAIAPLVQSGHNEWILELFHGPTLAFKDFALQFLGHLLDFFLARRNQRAVVLGATSGDTGSAAIEGCRRCANIDIFILHPHNRVSEVQRRQMTTVGAKNVHNIALQGNFDDCQNMVKASFTDQSFMPEGLKLVAVNSINWARIMAQLVYYFYSALALGGPHRAISYSVPTGNFGDIFAGYLAGRMGLPLGQLIIATNSNDILHRCISNNDHSKRPLQHSLSPSMDIMVSSNFERLLFDLYDRDGAQISSLMQEFEGGRMQLSESALSKTRAIFSSFSVDDAQMLQMMAGMIKSNGYSSDPHTAIGIAAARARRSSVDRPLVCLATAHPAKFPEAIRKAGAAFDPPLPDHISDLFERQERFQILENQITVVQSFIRQSLA